MTSLPAGPLLFDTGICIQFATGQTPVEPEQSSISPLASTFSAGVFLPAIASFSADSEFGFKVNVRDACQLLRQLSTLLCFEC